MSDSERRMGDLIERAMHNARSATPAAPNADVRSRARADLLNAWTRLSQTHDKRTTA